MTKEINEKLEKHINKILDKKNLKPRDINLLTVLLMTFHNPFITNGTLVDKKKGGK